MYLTHRGGWLVAGTMLLSGSEGKKLFSLGTILSVTAPALAKPWHASAMLPSPQPHAVAEEICEKQLFTG